MSLTNSSKGGLTSRGNVLDGQDGLEDSWVTLNVETESNEGDLSRQEIERLLREAQRESGQSSLAGSIKECSSPHTPCNSLRSTPNQSGEASPKNPSNLKPVPEILSEASVGKTDWVWDWSSTPEMRPPKKTQFKRPLSRSLSMRKSSAMKSGYFSWEFLQVFIPSMILTNLVAFGFGVYVGKRISSNRSA